MNQQKTKTRKTASEELFEEFCHRAEIGCERIVEEHDPRPDYEVALSGERAVVEVKQFDPNEEELESNRRAAAGGRGGTKTVPGDRIRKAIHRAAPQLRALSRGECPAMLVVYNNSGAGQHTDPYGVATAMQGLDVVPVALPSDPAAAPQFMDVRSGPGKKMTENANTTISAIGVLRIDPEGAPHLLVFHNRYARNPIEPDWFRHPHVQHLRWRANATSSLDAWEKA